MTCKRCPRGESGFTLIEVLVAATILIVGVLATLTIVSAASRANAANRQRDAATNLARDVVEAVRTIPYDRITNTGVDGELQAMPGLQDAGGGAYEIKRSGVTFQVSVDVCIVDDPADGGGARTATTTFCPSSTPAGTEDRNPEDYKKITATLAWRRAGGATASLVQAGVVNNPGSASGPAVRSIAPVGVAAPFVITAPGTTSLTFRLETSSRPHAINWLLDGTVQQPAPVVAATSGGLVWNFTWPIGPVEGGVLDGEYIVSGEAFNQYGVSGPSRQETIVLNRRIPYAPRQVTGGRTGFGTVEIEWSANRERDIIGYEVERVGASAPVCPLATQKLAISCIDPTPPDDDPLRYRVYAYDTDPVTRAPRRGEASPELVVIADNASPFAPTGLTLTRSAAGVVTLEWRRPSPEDPDDNDGVEFYRVYRDGTTLAHRYARWFDNSGTVRWQDTATDGKTHTYWVTAVDEHYAESPAGTGVTG